MKCISFFYLPTLFIVIWQLLLYSTIAIIPIITNSTANNSVINHLEISSPFISNIIDATSF